MNPFHQHIQFEAAAASVQPFQPLAGDVRSAHPVKPLVKVIPRNQEEINPSSQVKKCSSIYPHPNDQLG